MRNMIPEVLRRYVRQETQGKGDELDSSGAQSDDSDEYVTRIELVGTSTLEIPTSPVYIPTQLRTSQNNLQRMEHSVNTLSEKTKGKFIIIYNTLKLDFL